MILCGKKRIFLLELLPIANQQDTYLFSELFLQIQEIFELYVFKHSTMESDEHERSGYASPLRFTIYNTSPPFSS